MQKIYNHENTIQYDYSSKYEPSSVSELIRYLKICNQQKKKVKIFGGNCTFSKIKNTKGTIIFLGKIKELSKIYSVDRKNHTAIIGGNMKLVDIIDELYKYKLQFPMLGGWYGQTLGGAISTATHGTSFNHGTLSDCVIALEVILPTGEKVWIDENDERIKAFRAHLGVLGVITKVKFQFEPLKYMKCSMETYDNDEVAMSKLLDRVNDWGKTQTPYINMVWFPYYKEQGKCIIRKLSPIYNKKPNQLAIDLEDKVKKRGWFKNVLEDRGKLFLSKKFLKKPEKFKNLWSSALAGSFLKQDELIERSFRLFNYGQYREPNQNKWLRLVLNVEIALDVDQLQEAFYRIKNIYKKYYRKGIVANIPRVHFRFAESSDKTLLGTNSHRRTVYIGFYNFAVAYHKRQIPLAKEVERALDDIGGRPHWGKFRYLGQDENFKNTYGSDAWKFEKFRRSIDPNSVFSDGLKMWENQEMFNKDVVLNRPFSGMNPKNYEKVHFTGGLSRDI